MGTGTIVTKGTIAFYFQSLFEKVKKSKIYSSFSADDKCSGDKCPNGKLCVMKDNGNQFECVDGKIYD